LGGSYGKCSEYGIMKELYENGPIVFSFEPTYHFMHYKSGIYDSLKENWIQQGATKPEWEKVDHSVIAVGWGKI
jgi:cathepsin C